MKRSANVCTDTGIIMVGDLAYLDTVKKKAEPGSNSIGRTLNIDCGSHDIRWRIKNSHNGLIEGRQTINVESGKIFICDPCRVIDNWQEWLDNTAYGKYVDFDGVFIIDKMGGDGRFKVELDIDEDEI